MTFNPMVTPTLAPEAQKLMAQEPIASTATTPVATPSVAVGMDASFDQKIKALLAAAGGQLRIVSGYRSTQQQQALWNEALRKYGSESAARKWVAPPGHSNHEKGIAVDLGGDLALAHRLAPQFGLVFPMAWEDWHVEPAGARSNPHAYTDPPPGFPDPTSDAAHSSTPEHLAALAAALRLPAEDQTTAPPTATSPMSAAGGEQNPMATPVMQPEAQKLMAQEPIAGPPTVDEVNATAGQAGVMGNVSGAGHIETTPQRVSFAQAVLTKAGFPVTPENVRALVAWQQGEGTSASFNPLATTTGAPGASQFNSVGVKNFTSFDQGVDATVKTIFNGNYANIIAALQAGSSAVSVAQAIANSPWGTGGLVLKILGGGA